jgi:Putative restriction endonuclease
MVQSKTRTATYADIEALPPNVVGEILFGVLHTQPRPARRHIVTASRMGGVLSPPFEFGNGGPGGWIIADEPELHLGPHVLVPDLAGWRSERLVGKGDGAYFDEVPDWVCEIQSPSTKHLDLGVKRRIYATYEVPYLWHVDPVAQTLEIFTLLKSDWLLTHTFVGGQPATAPPFNAVTFDLKLLWPFDKPFETDGF